MHRSGGGWRLFYPDASGNLSSISRAFTDLEGPDPFVVQAAGRSYFCLEDLLDLVRLLEELRECGGQDV